jgi:hypothetical protein
MFTQQLKVIYLWHDDFYLLITITPDHEIWLYQGDTDNIIETLTWLNVYNHNKVY